MTTDHVVMTDIEQRWLRQKWALVRESQMAADEASRKWNQMNEAFKDWCRKSAIFDPLQIAQRKADNLELKDKMSVWDWHVREATRHMQDIQTFKTMKELGAL